MNELNEVPYRNITKNGTIIISPALARVILESFAKKGVDSVIANEILLRLNKSREWNLKFKDLILENFRSYVTHDYLHKDGLSALLDGQYVDRWVYELQKETPAMNPTIFSQQLPGTIPVTLSNGSIGFMYPQQQQMMQHPAPVMMHPMMMQQQPSMYGGMMMQQQASTPFGHPVQQQVPPQSTPQHQTPMQQQQPPRTEKVTNQVSTTSYPITASELKEPFDRKTSSEVIIDNNEGVIVIGAIMGRPINNIYDLIAQLERSWIGYTRKKWVIAIQVEELQFLEGIAHENGVRIFDEAKKIMVDASTAGGEHAGRVERVLDTIGRMETNHTYVTFENMVITAIERHMRSRIRLASNRNAAFTGLRSLRDIQELYRMDSPFKKHKEFSDVLDHCLIAGHIDAFKSTSVISDHLFQYALMSNDVNMLTIDGMSIWKHSVTVDQIDTATEFLKRNGTLVKSKKTVVVTNVNNDEVSTHLGVIRDNLASAGCPFGGYVEVLVLDTTNGAKAAGSKCNLATYVQPMDSREGYLCNTFTTAL